MIILSKEQAESLAAAMQRGGVSLTTKELKDGSFAVDEAALTVEENQPWRDYLEGLPRRPVSDDE